MCTAWNGEFASFILKTGRSVCKTSVVLPAEPIDIYHFEHAEVRNINAGYGAFHISLANLLRCLYTN